MSERKLDILNREEFINRVIQLVQLISSNKGNMTFAINGSWGCGKTFVLEEIERRLSEDESKQYLVIHYNCWQYDYYDEPLVALVSAINDYADSTKVIPEDTKIEIKNIVTKVGANLFTQVVKNKLGVDLSETITTAKEAIDSASAAVAEKHGYDAFFGFKSVLTALKMDLQELSEKYTLVFAVDELDRCLPEYAIKVLERLHHITEEIPNTITILAVDKKRLENTVCSIFGTEIGNAEEKGKTADEYLNKFIRFELKLDNGRQDAPKFFEKFPEFYARFDPSLYVPLNRTEQFIEELFRGIDPRSQEQIVEKATIFNDVCFGAEKQDHTMMYMELFMATLYYHCHDNSIFSDRKKVTDPLKVFKSYTRMPASFRSQNNGFCFSKKRIYRDQPGDILPVDQNDVFMILFYYWYHAAQPHQQFAVSPEFLPWLDTTNQKIDGNLYKLREAIKTLSIIA